MTLSVHGSELEKKEKARMKLLAYDRWYINSAWDVIIYSSVKRMLVSAYRALLFGNYERLKQNPRVLMQFLLRRYFILRWHVKWTISTHFLFKWTILNFHHHLVVKFLIMAFSFSHYVTKAYCVIAWVRYVSLFG